MEIEIWKRASAYFAGPIAHPRIAISPTRSICDVAIDASIDISAAMRNPGQCERDHPARNDDDASVQDMVVRELG